MSDYYLLPVVSEKIWKSLLQEFISAAQVLQDEIACGDLTVNNVKDRVEQAYENETVEIVVLDMILTCSSPLVKRFIDEHKDELNIVLDKKL